MTIEDRWMLPDGVEELLPEQARQAEALRRQLLDLYASWGYELVIPPLMEFTESLLIGLSNDVDLQTFKVVDQMSGRTLGIRADITPQTSRIDAHSLANQGPARLCYAGSVLHTRAKSPLASRSPIQLGAELYGVASIEADIEIISLMLETMRVAGVSNTFVELGHVAIFRALSAAAGMDGSAEKALFAALQRKATADINQQIDESVKDNQLATMLRALAHLNGDIHVLERAKTVLKHAPDIVLQALSELEAVTKGVALRMPDTEFHIDLSELRGYNYHTGIVFAAYSLGYGQAVAKGGRYDEIGQVFGRHRPATGFDCDLKAFLSLTAKGLVSQLTGIYVETVDSPAIWQKVQALRAAGERVVCGVPGQSVIKQELGCDRKLENENGVLVVKPL